MVVLEKDVTVVPPENDMGRCENILVSSQGAVVDLRKGKKRKIVSRARPFLSQKWLSDIYYLGFEFMAPNDIVVTLVNHSMNGTRYELFSNNCQKLVRKENCPSEDFRIFSKSPNDWNYIQPN